MSEKTLNEHRLASVEADLAALTTNVKLLSESVLRLSAARGKVGLGQLLAVIALLVSLVGGASGLTLYAVKSEIGPINERLASHVVATNDRFAAETRRRDQVDGRTIDAFRQADVKLDDRLDRLEQRLIERPTK